MVGDRPFREVTSACWEVEQRLADMARHAVDIQLISATPVLFSYARPAAQVVAFYNQRGTAEQWIKDGKNANLWTRLSCQRFRVRLQRHALAYILGNFMRTLMLPRAIANWSLTTLREKLVKIGAKVVRHGRYVAFQMAQVAVSRRIFGQLPARIARPRALPVPA